MATLAAWAALAMATACPAAPEGAAWAQCLRDDAQRFHDVMRDHHPGAVDADNPRFGAALEGGLSVALAHAERTRDIGGYWWALREYQAAFDDGHVQLATRTPLELPLRWAGVLTRYRNGRHVVAVREERDTSLPPLGAWLASCDGIPAETLAAQRLGRFSGRWQLVSQRVDNGPRLLLDEGNPWAALPQRCTFEKDGAEYAVAMRWRVTNREELRWLLAQAQPASTTDIALRMLPGGIAWISMGTFSDNANADSHPKLAALLAAVDAHRETIRRGPVVFDVRGNAGGSSHWSHRLAELVWGEAAVRRAAPKSDAVDWRVSDGNIAHVRKLRDRLMTAQDADPARLAWAEAIVSGMAAAQRQGLSLWRQAGEDEAADAETPPAIADATPAPRVYVLTDSTCASACLDAMDLWKALGVVQVGGETSADTTYMEIRAEPLPGGLVWAGVPVKVYRGRKRAANEAYRPDIPYDGDLADTEALQAWIARLAAKTEP